MSPRRTPEKPRPRSLRRTEGRSAARAREDEQPPDAAPPTLPGWGRRLTSRAAALWFVALSAFGAYANTLRNGFVNDDEHLILLNPWVESWRAFPAIFTGTAWGFLPGRSIAEYYRPLMHVVYFAIHQVFEYRAWAYHLVNVLLHVVVTLLVFRVVELWTNRLEPELPAVGESPRRVWLSLPFLSALLFALHPIHTEVVAWIASIPELTFTPLYLLAIVLYVSPQSERASRRALALGAFGLALLCKETAITLPALLVASDLALRTRRYSAREILRRQVPYLIVAAAYLVLRYLVLHGAMVRSASSWALGFGQLVATLPALFVEYLRLLVAPVGLSFWRPFHPQASPASAEALLGIVVTAAFGAALGWSWKRNRLAFLALITIAVPLAPVFYIDAFPRTPLAERYLYLPSLGFVLLVALAVRQLAGIRRWRLVALLGLVALATFYTAATVTRNRVWQDSYTLFRDSVAKAADTARPPLSLAAELLDRGHTDEALALYRILAEDEPARAEFRAVYGSALLRAGRSAEAQRELRAALALDSRSLQALNDLAISLRREGRLPEAVVLYRRAIAIDPAFPDAHFNLGSALADSGETAGALDQYRTAIGLRPADAYYQSVLAIELAKQGHLAEAIPHFEAAARLAPAEPAYRKNLERARALSSPSTGAEQAPQA